MNQKIRVGLIGSGGMAKSRSRCLKESIDAGYEIGQLTAMDKVAVSRAIAAMIQMGYLERKTSETDGRRSQLFLTPAGRDVYELIVPMALGAEQELASSLTEDEQKQLERLMGKLADAASPDRPLW